MLSLTRSLRFPGLSSLVLASVVLLGAPLLLAEKAPAPRPAKPNIIFILADDLGYGDIGCYGQKQIQTPQIDRLATEGTRFTQFYSGAPVCAPARNTLMTGQHTGHALFRGNAKINLPPEDTTIAQLLKGAGYRTGLIGKWGLGNAGSNATPRQKGFDHFFGYIDQTAAHNYYPAYLYRNDDRVPLRNVVPNPGPYDQGVASVKVEYSADLMADEALKFIRDHRDQPFFLYYAPTLPHANNESQPDGMEVPDYGPYANRDWPTPTKGFAAMVTRLDTHVGRILAELKQLGLDERTIVFFSSDNGPHAEGGQDPKFFNSNGGLRGVKRDLYEGGIRDPMIVRWPGQVPAGKVSSHVGYFPDVMPTLADLAGAKDAPRRDGLSFLPAILGDAAHQPNHAYLYWEYQEGKKTSQAVRMDNWKAVRRPILTGAIELYDLATDPVEKHDVAAQHPDIVARAAAAMQEAHTPSPHWK